MINSFIILFINKLCNYEIHRNFFKSMFKTCEIKSHFLHKLWTFVMPDIIFHGLDYVYHAVN